MPDPVVFISHFRVKDGALQSVQELARDVTRRLDADKPRTLLFLSFLGDDRNVISFLHAFPDADAMDAHVEGADERSRTAFEYIEPLGWEVYGQPSAAASESLRASAARAGVPLTVHPDFVAGFLHSATE